MVVLRKLLQVIWIGLSLVVVFAPETRTALMHYLLVGFCFVVGGWGIYRVLRAEYGSMTPRQLYAARVRADHLEGLAALLGVIAVILTT